MHCVFMCCTVIFNIIIIISYLFVKINYEVIYMNLCLLLNHVLCCLRLERHLSTFHGSSP